MERVQMEHTQVKPEKAEDPVKTEDIVKTEPDDPVETEDVVKTQDPMQTEDIVKTEPTDNTLKSTKEDSAAKDENLIGPSACSEYQQDCWIDFIQDDDLDVRVRKLAELNITISKSLKLKDNYSFYNRRTVCVHPLSFNDLASGLLSSFLEKVLFFSTQFYVTTDDSGQVTSEGVCYLHYKTEAILVKEFAKLQNLPKDLKCQRLIESDKGTQHTEGNTSIFEGESRLADSLVSAWTDVDRTTGQKYVVPGLPVFKEELTLFTTTITKDVTEDKLWEMFPLARFILLYTDPDIRLYVVFDNEAKLKQNISDLQAMTPCVPPFQITRLSDARTTFMKLLEERNNKNKKQGQNSQTLGASGKSVTQQLMAGSVTNASLALQGHMASKPKNKKRGKKRNGNTQKPGSTEQDTDYTVPMSGSQDSTVPVSGGQGGSADQTEQPKTIWTNGQLKRLRRRQLKQNMEARGGQDHRMEQEGRWQRPQRPQPSPDMAAMAILQTLTTLAKNMPGPHGPGPMNPPHMGNMGPGPGPYGPGPGPHRMNRKQQRKLKQSQRQWEMDQQRYGGYDPPQHPQKRGLEHSQGFSAENQGRFDGSFWRPPQNYQEGSGGKFKRQRKNQNQNQKREDATPGSDQVYDQNFAAQDYMSFEDSAVPNSANIAQGSYRPNDMPTGQGGTGTGEGSSANTGNSYYGSGQDYSGSF